MVKPIANCRNAQKTEFKKIGILMKKIYEKTWPNFDLLTWCLGKLLDIGKRSQILCLFFVFENYQFRISCTCILLQNYTRKLLV